jgi:GT2 family glycosyltransferase
MPEPVIGVVLLNWNGYDDTAATLQSLLDAGPKPALVIVVDNGSHDDSVTRLAGWARARGIVAEIQGLQTVSDFNPETWLRLIQVGENRGFAGGNNIGLAHLARDTNASHFLLLNNDALVATDYFARMNDAVRTTPGVGVMGCAIFHFPDTQRVWFAGGYEDRKRGVALHYYKFPSATDPYTTEWVTGCAMLISRELYNDVGGLAECYYPIYCEDVDYSIRARDAGATVMLAPAAHVYHKVGGTVGVSEVVPRVAYWQTRHRVFHIRRNYSVAERVTAISYLCVAKPLRSLLHAVRGRNAMASAVLRGLYHGLRDDISA